MRFFNKLGMSWVQARGCSSKNRSTAILPFSSRKCFMFVMYIAKNSQVAGMPPAAFKIHTGKISGFLFVFECAIQING